MERISDRLPEPFDRKLIISWNTLTSKGQSTLWRAIERSDIPKEGLTEGFSFELMTKIYIEDLNDARYIGFIRAKDLIQELISIFDNSDLQKDLVTKQRGQRLFPTKAELEAMQLARGAKDMPSSKKSPRRFPTKAELEAARASARRFSKSPEEEMMEKIDDQDLELRSAATLKSQIISVSSLAILAKLVVDKDLDKYLERIGSVQMIKPQRRSMLLQELLPSKNPFKRIMFGKRDQEVALGHLIDANLRLSFAQAKRVCPDRDIRARTVAGNLGLLAGINSFSDKPNVDFESHVMKNVREFIQDLIGSLNLSYDDIVELMLDANERELDLVDIKEQAETEVPFEGCTTFSELFDELDRELRKLPKVDDRAISMLKHRHQAFGEPGLTLDDIGKKWGVTRERVRQIVDPLMKASIQLENEVPLLLKAVEIFEECEDEDEFGVKVADDEIFSGEDISWQRLWGLTQILSPNVLANRVYAKHLELESESSANSPIRSSIKKDRSKFGLYDLQVVSKKYEINQDKAFKIISELYPRSIRSGSLVLARTKNLDTMFENSIAKQLKVSTPLEVRELLKGLQRTGRQRDVSLIGSTADLSNLILGLAGNPPNYETASKSLMKEVEFQTLEKWLVETFSGVNLGILHSNDVVNFALRDRRINVSSVTVYLLNSPIMRSHGRSIYSLVGTEVTEDQLGAYIQIIRGSSEVSEVSYEMIDASKGILSVKPNLNVITSGIVFPPSGYKKIFEGFEFETFCSCGQLETIQAVKFTPSGFWTGFTAMIRHGFSQHQMSKGSTFRFEFDFEKLIVRLLVN
jgi:DNA-directed RNA polymerase sigma subunit (sigma70/sigma32)